jgi:hypothetical protein
MGAHDDEVRSALCDCLQDFLIDTSGPHFRGGRDSCLCGLFFELLNTVLGLFPQVRHHVTHPRRCFVPDFGEWSDNMQNVNTGAIVRRQFQGVVEGAERSREEVDWA